MDQENQVLINDGTGTFTTALNLPGGAKNTSVVSTADLNGDGKTDIIIGNTDLENGVENQVLINDGSDTFTTTTALSLPGGAQLTRSIATADLNGDGKADIIIGNSGQENQVLINDGSGTFTTALNLPGGSQRTQSIAVLAV